MLAMTPVIGTISDSVMLGAAIHVDAVGSNFDGQSPQNLDIQWDFGDIDPAGHDRNHNRMHGFNAAHLYTAAGTYTIGLSVTDPLGNTTWATRQVTIAPDTRTLLTVNSQSQLNSLNSIAANTRVQFTGAAYTLTHSISLGGNVVLTSANADGGRTRLNAVDGLYEFFTVNGNNVTIGDLSLDTPSRAGGSGSAGTAMGFEASGQRQNITLENCELLNLNHVFVGNSKPTGVLFQDNAAPVVGGLRGHIAWAEGSRWTYVGNTTASNSQSIINTATNISLINISDNSFSRSSSGGVSLDYGPEYVYIGGNSFNRAKTQTNGTWTGVIVDKAQYIRFERNDITQADIVVRAGTAHTIFTNNTFNYEGHFYAAFQFNLGYDAGKGLTVEDIVVSHNTLRPNGYNMAGLMVHNPPSGLTIEGNLFDAAGMSVGVEQRSGMYTKVPLSSLTVRNNAWVLPSAGYNGVYQYNNGSWQTPSQWSALVPSDAFYNTYAAAAAGGAGAAAKPAVTGPSSIGEGSAYTLSLNPGGWEASRLHWLVNWGDGVVQQITGPASTATHVYGDGPASYTISATANDGIGNYTPSPLAVSVENSDPVVGFQTDPPDQMTAGGTARFPKGMRSQARSWT